MNIYQHVFVIELYCMTVLKRLEKIKLNIILNSFPGELSSGVQLAICSVLGVLGSITE